MMTELPASTDTKCASALTTTSNVAYGMVTLRGGEGGQGGVKGVHTIETTSNVAYETVTLRAGGGGGGGKGGRVSEDCHHYEVINIPVKGPSAKPLEDGREYVTS